MPAAVPTRRDILAQAWPIMLGQATVPLVGLVDVAVIGRTGDTVALAAVALGTTIINFLFWTFGFLRMGVTGTTAQAQGAGDVAEVRAVLARGLLLGLALGAGLTVFQAGIVPLSVSLFAADAAIDRDAAVFVAARLWGAPAALAVYALNGWLIGVGRTREALALQLVLNLVNAALDTLFVWQLGWGTAGIGYGTALAEWSALAAGLGIVAWVTGRAGLSALRVQTGLFAWPALRRMLALNADIAIRTVALLVMFSWFTNSGARLGAVPLAANHVLMQFVTVSAFVLDGIAYTAEARIGAAIGGGSWTTLRRTLRLCAELSLVAGAVFAGLFLVAGGGAIAALTTSLPVRALAAQLLPLVAAIPLVGAAAWLLDAIFLGAAAGRQLRNAAMVATALYIATDLLLRPYGPAGIWIAMLIGYLWRAGGLALALPRLLRTLASPPLRS